ncbi:MAG: hypothetical protein Q8L48_29505 [Archangium sp.]|nr:hypothetical protein [Archangium sp.]
MQVVSVGVKIVGQPLCERSTLDDVVGPPHRRGAVGRSLVALHDAASVHFALAGARRRWGDPQGALVEADWLRAHWPAAAPFAEHERALCFVDLHQAEAALEAWAKSLPVHAGLHEQHRLDPFVVALTQSAPGDARVAALARAHWLKRGKVMGPP